MPFAVLSLEGFISHVNFAANTAIKAVTYLKEPPTTGLTFKHVQPKQIALSKFSMLYRKITLISTKPSNLSPPQQHN